MQRNSSCDTMVALALKKFQVTFNNQEDLALTV
nr:MAG TPA: hypothetical protein [Bacteriophage sp.]